MNDYRIIILKPARKFIEQQTKAQQTRILKAIYKLPHEGDIKPLAGIDNVYRLRVGSYRVIFTINADILTIVIMTAGNRGDIY